MVHKNKIVREKAMKKMIKWRKIWLDNLNYVGLEGQGKKARLEKVEVPLPRKKRNQKMSL